MPFKLIYLFLFTIILAVLLLACEKSRSVSQPVQLPMTDTMPTMTKTIPIKTRIEDLDEFDDGSGIERYILSHPAFNYVYHIYSNDLQSKYLIPDVRQELNKVLQNSSRQVQVFITSDRPTDELATNHKGDALLHGRNVEVSSYIDVDSHVQVHFARGDSDQFNVMTVGSRVNSYPSGETTYEGTNLLTVRNGGNEIYEGYFLFSIDFSNSKGNLITIQGKEDDYFANTQFPNTNVNFSELTGEFQLNLRNGTFASDMMTLKIYEPTGDISDSHAASIYGTLHGKNSSGITGIYHDNTEIPEYIGAIIGHVTKPN